MSSVIDGADRPALQDGSVGRTIVLAPTTQLLALHTRARDARADRTQFLGAAQRIMRAVLEEALGLLRHEPVTTTTPNGLPFQGLRRAQDDVYAVSIPRAGDAFESELRALEPGARIGKILIQRDPVTLRPELYYRKLPPTIAGREVVLMDPMLATAGTAVRAVEVLAEAGVAPADIVFANVLTCPQGLDTLHAAHPEIRVVTSVIDDGLTEQALMRPGIGDFGDRFYGTAS